MPSSFDLSIDRILKKNTLFQREAYYFLNNALGKALAPKNEKQKNKPQEHIRANTLVYALKDLALEEYGPLAKLVLENWGIKNTSDIGTIVYLLIEEGIWSKTEEDKQSDFDGIMDFNESLLAPFLPVIQEKPVKKKRSSSLTPKKKPKP